MVGSKSLNAFAIAFVTSIFFLTSATAERTAIPEGGLDGQDQVDQSIVDEEILLETQSEILNGEFNLPHNKNTALNANVILQAIDDVTYSGETEILARALDALEQIEKFDLTLAQRIQAESIRREIAKKDTTGNLKIRSNSSLKYTYFFKALSQQLDKKAIVTLLSNEELFQDEAAWRSLINWSKGSSQAQGFTKAAPASPSADVIRDIFNYEPQTNVYASGRYHKKPRIYMFCRSVRKYPCLMVMKDNQGKIWKNNKGEVWSQPALAYSRHNKPSNKPSGDTPAGVQRIDSVMPSADQQMVFGKYRRLILNFVGEGTNESYTKLLLPPSSHNADWWKQASVARDIGRSALRIHGTGLRSSAFQPYYPMVPTSGCIAKRENKYGGTTYADQRELLDEMMKASGLSPIYSNETELKGLIYMIEIDAKKSAVSMADLKALGLF